MNKIGIMQGRLSLPTNGKIQSFPTETWREEFYIAKDIGLSSIEWILESPLRDNPMMHDKGCDEIKKIIADTGVTIDFVCADYFMESPFVRMNEGIKRHNIEILMEAIDRAALLGVRGIEIPCVDASAIQTEDEEREIAEALIPCLKHAKVRNIQVGLETSLSAVKFKRLLEALHPYGIYANYDSGNSASLGYDPIEEMSAYGQWINNVHIKDRILGGTTVPLGTGDTDIPKVLKLLKDIGYSGGLILQAARQMQGNEKNTVKGYISQLKNWISGI